MSDNVWPVAAGDGRSGLPPGTAPGKGRRQRRPSGAPPPLPHPVSITTTAWLTVAALVAGLTGVGMQAGPAVSAVLLYRLATYWLPVAPGWLAWRALLRRGYV